MNSDDKEIEIEIVNAFLRNFILVEGGEYTMGDAEIINAKPHAVILNSFYKC
jgi:hypothetical protein